MQPPHRLSTQTRRVVRCLGAGAAVAILAFVPGSSDGGEWHRLRALVCSECHTMHNSQDGRSMRYDNGLAPVDKLLRAASANDLCLACHSGTIPSAPNVTVPTDFDPPGGGFPVDLTDPNHQAHGLGPNPVTPPDGDTPVVMACVTCHDPHGNGQYRNLRPSPSGTGRAAGVPVVVRQTVTANGLNAADVYKRSNVLYQSGMSAWCMDCHNLYSNTHAPQVALASGATVNMTHWLNDPITSRVPVQSPTDLVVPSTDDQVFCLSCHKAHGSPHLSAELWADGDAGLFDATCNQCHAL